jgi:hypothetical protein
VHVTVSIGVASGPGLLALADQRLYQAKNAGRNRVIGPPDASYRPGQAEPVSVAGR